MNKANSIFLQKFDRLQGYQIKNALIDFFNNNEAPLTDKQRLMLTDACERGMYGDLDLPFQAYKWKKNDSETSNMWWRISIPFYFIYWLLMVILMPFKWLFTGKWYYDPDSRYIAPLRKWYCQIFGEC